MILCRNLVLTYFDADLQQKVLSDMLKQLIPGGVFVVGSHEYLPEKLRHLQAIRLGVYQKE
ncbi:CheR family methyltransferase [Coleofasciculus sp.]|uniref:CheR family methyltransferase n=1 Tax=Coleofasciculus sp. TaxID=3100458 RepID=UPI0039F9261A